MKLRVAILLILFLKPWYSDAFFPPETKSTSREVLDYRRRKQAEYDRERLEYEKQMVASRVRVESSLESMPWQGSLSQNPEGRNLLLNISKVENVKNENKALFFFLISVVNALFLSVLFINRRILWQFLGKE